MLTQTYALTQYARPHVRSCKSVHHTSSVTLFDGRRANFKVPAHVAHFGQYMNFIELVNVNETLFAETILILTLYMCYLRWNCLYGRRRVPVPQHRRRYHMSLNMGALHNVQTFTLYLSYLGCNFPYGRRRAPIPQRRRRCPRPHVSKRQNIGRTRAGILTLAAVCIQRVANTISVVELTV